MVTGVVIPAKNESGRIGKVLTNIKCWSPDIIVVVANGCEDKTVEEAIVTGPPNTHIIEFTEPLGIDVPRAVGARYAYEFGADIIVFIDGDMSGHITPIILQLLEGIKKGSDIALVNCYPYITQRLPLTQTMLYFRKLLNQELGLLNDLGVASPCHGPHAVSRKLLSQIGFTPLAVPPLELAMARIYGGRIRVHAAIPHIYLKSQIRSNSHPKRVTETIIGDCIEAIRYCRGEEKNRVWEGVEYDGYNSQRRWDLLQTALTNLGSLKAITPEDGFN